MRDLKFLFEIVSLYLYFATNLNPQISPWLLLFWVVYRSGHFQPVTLCLFTDGDQGICRRDPDLPLRLEIHARLHEVPSLQLSELAYR